VARRLPVMASCGILAGMHKPICAGVLSIASILLTLAIPWSGAHAAVCEASAPVKDVGYEYTVQPTDTLWDIAATHGITVNALIAANKLADPRLLRPGQTLWVPALPPAIAAPSAKAISPGKEAGPAEVASATMLPPGKESWPPELLSLINTSRGAAGLPPLTWSPELARAAQAHAADCARRNQGGHLGSDGARLEARIARQGLVVHRASENWANAQSIQHAFALWWNEAPGSDPHRRNILDPKYTEIGIGVADGKWGTYFVADFAGP
jgi:LysM repeat protein